MRGLSEVYERTGPAQKLYVRRAHAATRQRQLRHLGCIRQDLKQVGTLDRGRKGVAKAEEEGEQLAAAGLLSTVENGYAGSAAAVEDSVRTA